MSRAGAGAPHRGRPAWQTGGVSDPHELAELADRGVFLERIRLQLQARYPDYRVEADVGRWGLRLRGPGVDSRIPLTPLHQAVLRTPTRTGALIADFVRTAEAQLTPMAPMQLSLARAVWCVRTEVYVGEHSRGSDLLVRPVAGELVAFMAEELPNSIMRGVPREEWAPHGEVAARAAADRATAAKFTALPERIRAAGRVPADGWSFRSDPLFQGSMMLVPAVLAALVERAGGDVLLATPDRGEVLAVPVSAPGAATFQNRVVRAWREALQACSRQVVVTNGTGLAAVDSREAPRTRGRHPLRRLRG